jgi:cation diffusion facilitator family transporter
MAGSGDSLKSIWYALGANLAIALAKFGAATVTGSGAMLAEAIHSFADCGNQVLLLWGLKASKAPPSPEFPLGYGKAIYFWSFIVALVLFTLGGVFSIYEGMHKMTAPEELKWPELAIGVLVFGIVAESLSLWGCLREVNKSRGSKSLVRWARESRQSELIVVLGEDIAALFGLLFALVFILLALYTGNPVYDAYGSIVIGILLVLIAVFVGVEIKGLLIGQSVDEEIREAIYHFIDGQSDIETVFNLITLQLGNDVMLAAKVKLREFPSNQELIVAINRIERELKSRFTQVKWSFFEPDIAD